MNGLLSGRRYLWSFIFCFSLGWLFRQVVYFTNQEMFEVKVDVTVLEQAQVCKSICVTDSTIFRAVLQIQELILAYRLHIHSYIQVDQFGLVLVEVRHIQIFFMSDGKKIV